MTQDAMLKLVQDLVGNRLASRIFMSCNFPLLSRRRMKNNPSLQGLPLLWWVVR
jgi:hypothetical protein